MAEMQQQYHIPSTLLTYMVVSRAVGSPFTNYVINLTMEAFINAVLLVVNEIETAADVATETCSESDHTALDTVNALLENCVNVFLSTMKWVSSAHVYALAERLLAILYGLRLSLVPASEQQKRSQKRALLDFLSCDEVREDKIKIARGNLTYGTSHQEKKVLFNAMLDAFTPAQEDVLSSNKSTTLISSKRTREVANT